MINQYNFQVGDVVYVPLYGIFRHYGVVVEAGNYIQEPIIRTVLRTESAPVNQTASQFANGQGILSVPYPSQRPRWEVVQSALGVLNFSYCPVTNNCENFYRRAHGLTDISIQATLGGLATIGILTYCGMTKKLPTI